MKLALVPHLYPCILSRLMRYLDQIRAAKPDRKRGKTMKAAFKLEIGHQTPAGYFLSTEMSRNGGSFQAVPQQGPFASIDAARAAGDAFAAKVGRAINWQDSTTGASLVGSFEFEK
jgi:hypothetical protein